MREQLVPPRLVLGGVDVAAVRVAAVPALQDQGEREDRQAKRHASDRRTDRAARTQLGDRC